jgi:hypothetical protein
MDSSLLAISCATFPWQYLPALGPVRALPHVEAARVDDRAWLRWQPGSELVLERILPLPGADFYVLRDQYWFRFGCHLPAFDVPSSVDYQPLHKILMLGSFGAETPARSKSEPATLSLVSDDRVRLTTAALYSVTSLAHWIEMVPTPRLAGIQAAICGDEALLLGTRLPILPGCERFWGNSLLIPLGYRPEPLLPESALREGLAVAENDLLLWNFGGVETISRSVFTPLSRSGIRLVAQAARESI